MSNPRSFFGSSVITLLAVLWVFAGGPLLLRAENGTQGQVVFWTGVVLMGLLLSMYTFRAWPQKWTDYVRTRRRTDDNVP